MGRFTPSNRLLKMDLGEGRQTWGTDGINRVLALLDDALDGVTLPADPILQVGNAADEARNRVLVCTEPAHVLPDVPKWYHALNPLPVDCVISCGVSSVTVHPGQLTVVLCDGQTVRLAPILKGRTQVVVPPVAAYTVPLTAYGALVMVRRNGTVTLPASPPSDFRVTLLNRSGNEVDVVAPDTMLADDFLHSLLVDQDGTYVVAEDDVTEIGCVEEGMDGNVLQLYDGQVVELVWSSAMGRWVTLRS